MPAGAWVFSLYNHFGSHPPVPLKMRTTMPYLYNILTIDHTYDPVKGDEEVTRYSRIPTLVCVIVWLAMREEIIQSSTSTFVFRLQSAENYSKLLDTSDRSKRKGFIAKNVKESSWTQDFSPRFELTPELEDFVAPPESGWELPSTYSTATLHGSILDLAFRMLYDWPFRDVNPDKMDEQALSKIKQMDRTLRYFSYKNNVVKAFTATRRYAQNAMQKKDPDNDLRLKKLCLKETPDTNGTNARTEFAPWLVATAKPILDVDDDDEEETEGQQQKAKKEAPTLSFRLERKELRMEDGSLSRPKIDKGASPEKNLSEKVRARRAWTTAIEKRSIVYLEKFIRLTHISTAAKMQTRPVAFDRVDETFNKHDSTFIWSALAQQISSTTQALIWKRMHSLDYSKLENETSEEPKPSKNQEAPEEPSDSKTIKKKQKEQKKAANQMLDRKPLRIALESNTVWKFQGEIVSGGIQDKDEETEEEKDEDPDSDSDSER